MLRIIGSVLIFIAGIGFGMVGINNILTFPQVACIAMLICGGVIMAYDYLENS